MSTKINAIAVGTPSSPQFMPGATKLTAMEWDPAGKVGLKPSVGPADRRWAADDLSAPAGEPDLAQNE